MDLYARHIFPRLCDWIMRSPQVQRLRGETLAEVEGETLEIGFGTGLNLEHYPDHVRRIVAVDPAEGMARIARRRIERSRIDVDLRVQTAEELPFQDGRFDCVVSTWTLCGIRDARRTIAEIGRVLRPGGRFLYLEHGLSEEPAVQRWQHRLTPLHKRVAGGCHLDVDIEALVRSGAFRDVRAERFPLPRAPRLVGSLYRGTAVK